VNSDVTTTGAKAASPVSEEPNLHRSLERYYRGAPVMVLGATGFIGRWVARYLTAAGADLHLGVRRGGVADALCTAYGISGAVHEIDAGDIPSVEALLGRVRPAVVFNLVGYGVDRSERDPAVAQRVNAEFVEALCSLLPTLSGANWPGQRLVHVGSALEYGSADGDLYEECVPQPTDWYGKTKLAGTAAVTWLAHHRAYPAVSARVFTVYGPGEHDGRLLPSLIAAAQAGTTLELTSGTQERDFTYVEDIASGLLRLGVAPNVPGGTVNVATGRLTSVGEFARTAAQILRIGNEQLHFGRLAARSNEMRHEAVRIDRLRAATGWSPSTDVPEGIHKTIRFSGGDREPG
jgi:UDP-glucose 4-epimerase